MLHVEANPWVPSLEGEPSESNLSARLRMASFLALTLGSRSRGFLLALLDLFPITYSGTNVYNHLDPSA